MPVVTVTSIQQSQVRSRRVLKSTNMNGSLSRHLLLIAVISNIVSNNNTIMLALGDDHERQTTVTEKNRTPNDPYCNKACKTSEDCSSSATCTVCAPMANVDSIISHSDTVNSTNIKVPKVCMSKHTQSCGGPPLPPRKHSLPQYLVIGDSITRGYFPNLQNRSRINGVADAHLCPGAPNTTADGVNCVDVWLGPNPDRWDVISFNFGINDIPNNDILSYEVNLKNMTDILIKTKAAKAGKLIFVLTTPVSNSTSCCPQKSQGITQKRSLLSETPVTNHQISFCPFDTETYNDKARVVMGLYRQQKVDIIIDDLWSWANLYCCHLEDCTYAYCDIQPSPPDCPVEFNGLNGWDYLATNVSMTVRKVLKQKTV